MVMKIIGYHTYYSFQSLCGKLAKFLKNLTPRVALWSVGFVAAKPLPALTLKITATADATLWRCTVGKTT